MGECGAREREVTRTTAQTPHTHTDPALLQHFQRHQTDQKVTCAVTLKLQMHVTNVTNVTNVTAQNRDLK